RGDRVGVSVVRPWRRDLQLRHRLLARVEAVPEREGDPGPPLATRARPPNPPGSGEPAPEAAANWHNRRMRSRLAVAVGLLALLAGGVIAVVLVSGDGQASEDLTGTAGPTGQASGNSAGTGGRA